MVTKNERGGEEHNHKVNNTIIQVLSPIVAIGGYFKFERVLSL